jgi:hypothetical protein
MYYICVHFFIKKTIEVLLNFNFINLDDNLESKYYIQGGPKFPEQRNGTLLSSH